jgi:hypothetical protein
MSSTLLSAVAKLPWDLVLSILAFDSRCVIRNGECKRVVGSLAKQDSRYSFLQWMFEDHARWAKIYARERDVYGRNQVGIMLPVGRHKSYVVDIYDAEYYNNQTGEYFYELVREWSFERNEQCKWVYEL